MVKNKGKYTIYFILSISLVITFIFLFPNKFGIKIYGDAYGYNAMPETFIRQGLGNFHLKL